MYKGSHQKANFCTDISLTAPKLVVFDSFLVIHAPVFKIFLTFDLTNNKEKAMILLLKKRVFLGSLLFCLLLLLFYSGYIFNEGRESALLEIRGLCDKVMHQDKENRLNEIDALSYSGYKESDCDTTITYFNGHVEKIVKNDNAIVLMADEKQYRVDQSFLLMENPIQIFVLDSLFNLALQQNNMSNIQTALLYTVNNETVICSNPDSAFYLSATALSPITTGIKDEISIQAYVDIPISYVIGRHKEHFLILLIVFCLTLGVLFTIWYNKKFMVPIQETTRKLIKIKENLLFDKEKGVLYFNGDIQVALSNRRLDIFVLLLESPEHFQTSKEIIRIVWGNGGTSDVLNSTLKRLRDNLEPIPDIKIVHENSGYCLHID